MSRNEKDRGIEFCIAMQAIAGLQDPENFRKLV
jgi:hypothetical protein